MSAFSAPIFNILIAATTAVCMCLLTPLSATAENKKASSLSAAPANVASGQVSPRSASSAKIKAIHLEQTHFYWGPMDILVCDSGIRIQNKGAMKFTLVSAAPNWQVTVYRNDDHTKICEPLAEFSEIGMVPSIIISKQAKVVDEVKTTTVKYGEFKARRVNNPGFMMEYLPVSLPSQAKDILYSVYRQPANGGLVLHCAKYHNGKDWMTGLKNNEMKVSISTQKLNYAPASRSDFEPPGGLKKADSMQEVIMSKAKRATAGEASELFDVR